MAFRFAFCIKLILRNNFSCHPRASLEPEWSCPVVFNLCNCRLKSFTSGAITGNPEAEAIKLNNSERLKI